MHVLCTENYMQLTLERRRYAKIDPASLHLTDPNCGPTFYNDTLMFIRAPLGSCGTVAGRSGILLEFRNEVYGDLAGRSTMAQEPAYQFRLRCRYYTTAKLMRRSPSKSRQCNSRVRNKEKIFRYSEKTVTRKSDHEACLRVRPHFRTQKRLENTGSGVFLSDFEVFGNVIKHGRKCLEITINKN